MAIDAIIPNRYNGNYSLCNFLHNIICADDAPHLRFSKRSFMGNILWISQNRPIFSDINFRQSRYRQYPPPLPPQTNQLTIANK